MKYEHIPTGTAVESDKPLPPLLYKPIAQKAAPKKAAAPRAAKKQPTK